MQKNTLWWVTCGLITAGILLWLINWWAGRPLFLDESNVARNLYDRSFAGLFSPLDYRQYAPPLYLVLAKACGELFGYGERSLRIPSLLGGLLAVWSLVAAGRALKLGWWGLLPLALLFVNPVVLRYAAEVKPYALDLGIAAVVLAWGVSERRPGWWTAILGAVAVWASLPAIFVLASVGVYRFLPPLFNPSHRTSGPARMVWLLNGVIWLASFALLYFLVLSPSVGSKYLNQYHGAYFFPVPGQEAFLQDGLRLLNGFFRLSFGFTSLAIGFGWVVAAAVFWHKKQTWLLLPTGLVIGASAFGQYSLIPRLLLFVLPGWWLLAAVLGKRVSARFPGWGTWAFALSSLLVCGGTNVVQHYFRPQIFSDSRRLVRELEPGYTPVLHHGAVPAYDYYYRIHPTAPPQFTALGEGHLQNAVLPGNYVLLYDVLTQGNIRESVQQDSLWAAARGCEVRSVALFRAKALYVSCPAKTD